MVVKKLRDLTRRRDTDLCLVLAPACLYTTADLFKNHSNCFHYLLLSLFALASRCQHWIYLGSQQCSDIQSWCNNALGLTYEYKTRNVCKAFCFLALKESANTCYILSHGGVSTKMRAWVWRLVAVRLRRLSPTCCFSVSHLADKGLYTLSWTHFYPRS